MRAHRLKTWPEPFQAVWDRRKTHEVRVDDRGYAVGDLLALMEWEPTTVSNGTLTGRWITAMVTYVTQGGRWGLPGDTCVMSVILLDSGAVGWHELHDAVDEAVKRAQAVEAGRTA